MEVFCRREIKFLVTDQQRMLLTAALARHMVPDRYAHSSIENVYYDTPDFRLIRRSLEHPLYKEKIRMRSYGGGEVFLEMKKKYDGIVYKRRMTLPEDLARDFLAGKAALPDTQIGREMTYFRDFYWNLRPQVFLRYQRDSWRGSEDPGLRITLDNEIYYRTGDFRFHTDERDVALLEPGTSLMEVKAENAIPLWLTELLARLKIQKVSFSKYGRAYERELRQKIQKNRGYLYVG